MFNLEHAIIEWRRQMLAAGIKTPALLDELESHLREDMEQQVRSGLNEQQAFALAVQRLGHANALKQEFAKTDGAREVGRRELDTVTSIACACVAALTYACIMCLPVVWSAIGLQERMLGFLAVGLGSLTLCSWRHLGRFLPIIPNRRTRTRVQLATAPLCVVWLAVFFEFIWPRFDTTGQLVVSLVWALMIPFGVLGGLAYGLEEAVRRQINAADS